MVQASRKNTESKFTVNKKMNDKTYALRRQVIELLYEIKSLVPSLPRIDVRICDAKRGESVLGVGRMNCNFIWITEEAISSPRFDLREVVYHEVLHAVYGVEHDEHCPLMGAYTKGNMTKAEIQKHFMTWVKKASKKKA